MGTKRRFAGSTSVVTTATPRYRNVVLASLLDILVVVGFVSPHFWLSESWAEWTSGVGDIRTSVVDAVIVVLGRNMVLHGTCWLCHYLHITLAARDEATVEAGTVHISTVQGTVVYDAIPSDAVEHTDGFERHFTTQRLLAQSARKRQKIDTYAFVISFALITGSSLYLAIKAISMDYEHLNHSNERAALLCASALLSNVIFAMGRSYQNGISKPHGETIRLLHPHPLRFEGDVTCRYCDVCNSHIYKEGYTCVECDFDSCLTCYKKKKQQQLVQQLEGGGTASDGDKEGASTEAISAWGYLWRSLKLTYPLRYTIGGALVCLLINQGSRLLLPNFQGHVIDNVILQNREGFKKNLMAYVSLTATIVVFGSIRSALLGIAGRKLNNHIRCKLFRSLLLQDIAFFDASTVGQLTSRMTNDASAMTAPINTLVDTVLSNIILLIGSLILCFITAWKLSILMFCSVGPIVYITGVYAKWSRKINRSIWDALAVGNETATQAFTNIRTVRSFSTEKKEIRKYNKSLDEVLDKSIKDSIYGAFVNGWTNLIDLGVIALILTFGGIYAMNGEGISVGQLITFQLYANLMNTSYQALNNVLNSFTRAAGAATRVLTLMDMLPEVDPDAGHVISAADFQGDFHFRDVTFRYPQRPERPVLKNLNLTIEAGKVTAIVGKSGAGKTTILHLLMRFYDPEAGDILVNRTHTLKSLNLNVFHDRVAIVSQDTQLFAMSIEDNILYGAMDGDGTVPTPDHEEIIRVAKLACVDEFVHEMDDRYKTKVGERGVRLSGGQRQRVGIARALLRQPKVLLLDEATSALDAESESKVMIAIRNLMRTATTVVIVAHRLSTVQNADKIVVLSEGKVCEEGTHTALLERGEEGIYARLVKHQVASGRTDITDEVFDVIARQDSDQRMDQSTVVAPKPSTPPPQPPLNPSTGRSPRPKNL